MRDEALQENFLYENLVNAYMEHDRLIIAYDIDDTVRPYKSKCCEDVKELIRIAKEILNPYFIVFTANPHYEKNIQFLNEENLPYDAINENIPEIGRYGDGLKIYYNLFFDDKAARVVTRSVTYNQQALFLYGHGQSIKGVFFALRSSPVHENRRFRKSSRVCRKLVYYRIFDIP